MGPYAKKSILVILLLLAVLTVPATAQDREQPDRPRFSITDALEMVIDQIQSLVASVGLGLESADSPAEEPAGTADEDDEGLPDFGPGLEPYGEDEGLPSIGPGLEPYG